VICLRFLKVFQVNVGALLFLYLAEVEPLKEYQKRRIELEARKWALEAQAQQIAVDTAQKVEIMQIACSNCYNPSCTTFSI